MKINVKENIRISLESIRSHFLRTILTVLIIAFGITALVGILTSIDAIKYFFTKELSMMGANSFSINNRGMNITINGKRIRPRNNRIINFEEAKQFKEQFKMDGYTSVNIDGTWTATVKYESEKSHPNVNVKGVDKEYLFTSGETIAFGRNFSDHDIQYGQHMAIIGSDIVKTLFKNNEDPIGKIITVGPGKYKVIGVIKEKGSSIGFSGDRSVWIPLNNVRQYFSRPDMNYRINVLPNKEMDVSAAVGEATGLFRIIRKDKLGDLDSFAIIKSDNLAEMLLENLKAISIAATVIGLITLAGAAIGLMNIMLVSVTERTREIGIRKALGATGKMIRSQFLIEAVVISQIGGVVGIIFGIAIGNLVSFQIGSSFIIPWNWMIIGVLLCFGVALLSGILPANKAAKLDPIDSLRHE
ncbi:MULTISPECIES: ABC transporter permease [unclassified Lentimicrobium]|uniref:ABC transporter permease n=1 Tax=unclassified Lentimicrobium TaxID=2677434 RepID=UPI001C12F07C|nr:MULTISPECIES: ABC transporter permease [unclassified Lentimicrobium]